MSQIGRQDNRNVFSTVVKVQSSGRPNKQKRNSFTIFSIPMLVLGTKKINWKILSNFHNSNDIGTLLELKHVS